MTDEELKELVAENSRAIREMRAESDRNWREFREEMRALRQEYQAETASSRQEHDEKAAASRQEYDEKAVASRQEYDEKTTALRQEYQAEIAASQQEYQAEIAASRQEYQAEIAASRQEYQAEIAASRRELKEELVGSRRELDRFMQSIDRGVEELRREVGRITNKFGDYSESLCQPSLIRTLRERFHMTAIAPRYRAYHNGHAIEVDLLAHANNQINEVYVAEIKTHLRQDGIEQILEHLRVFPEYFPEHRGKRLYGILAAIDAPPELRKKVIREGLYLMLISGEVLEMQVPDDFEPRAFPTD
jgi:hypothetical protein